MTRRHLCVILLFQLCAVAAEARSGCCAGDCSGDGRVTIDELVVGVNIALGTTPVGQCRAFDTGADGVVTVDELVTAVNTALRGCAFTFDAKLRTLAWLAYAPTSYNPNLGCPAGTPTEASMRADLQAARARGFDGMITFTASCSLWQIPRIAREVGFRGVIMGLFLFNEAQRAEEVPHAKAAAPYVDAYGIGNEGLIGCGGASYSRQTLTATMREIRSATGKPVTTSEQIEDYLLAGACADFLMSNGDWLFPITHPFNNGIRVPAAGVAFTEERYRRLSARTAKAVFFKETGWPTGGDPAATEANQGAYFTALAKSRACFAYFEGFDQPFKRTFATPWEPFWGLFRQDRAPKRFIAHSVPRRAGCEQ
ncbi:MAG: hypothetical protein ACE5I7_17025 [Candidatus Binatia bacterium]